ncbi:hypothetical protein [Agrobacterium pusense]|uniref:hypothetical protein n=1 Tax=Agrobacterium pusense TaxID=648995 RepID=UPI0010AEB42C|nr:hypothetical protein [Agrobacterium pusense]WCK26370.1 hypothetical protein CFBP5496_0019305 [Agrobacterium pusense]
MSQASSCKKNVVIVRAGTNSLHTGFLDLPYRERDFDVVVSYYDAEAYVRHSHEPGVTAHLCPGGKWDGLYRTLSWMGETLECYDLIWLPDDDIEATAGTINRLFELMKTRKLSVGQPSLTPDSYFTHFIFLNCPGTAVRWTNYVEIMVPCLSRDVLRAVLPHFENNMSGFGLDYIWCRLPETGEWGAGILDEVQVNHTRPVGKFLLSKMSQAGLSPNDEQAVLDAQYGVSERITPLIYGMKTAAGKQIFGLRACCWQMVRAHLAFVMRSPSRSRNYGIGRIYQLIRRQLTRDLDMRPLTRKGACK